MEEKRKNGWLPWVNWSPRTRRRFVTGIIFITPWLIGFLLFTLYPMLSALYTSFTIYHIKASSEWVGLANYKAIVHDKRFWIALYNTTYMVVVGVPSTLIGSFLCAILLNLKLKGQSIYRVIYFIPSIIPVVAASILWVWIYNTNNGILNTALSFVGINGPSWLTDPHWSKPALIIMGWWAMGGTIVIYLSGLQDVPVSLLEAAELDGANWFQRLWHVTVPMVSSITLFNLILGVINMFQYFTQAYVFATSQASYAVSSSRPLGAPLDSTLFYSIYLYYKAFITMKFGYASALAWILFFIILGSTLLLMKSSEKWTYYGEEL